ncbi:MAG: hypothetical protein A2X86_17140 [Bdellovibrionales bacterium GWA2_49_15]|nr:MAG: hypothetical protein A2X86_17140 [Bdellovibrionales bacterium GWA2_49_15]HAZ14036.1 B12-binding domain-containing radical SAM protein [Bdellovibrionales bacterium]
MKILLVHTQHAIQRFGTGMYQKYLRYAPLTMPTLAALVPAELHAEVRVIDEMVEEVDLNWNPDLVGITAISSASPRAYEIARHFKNKGATIVMGGVHATLMTEEALEHVDVVVKGYAEEVWPQILHDFKNGCLKRVYEMREYNSALSVSPARQFIRRSRYIACNTVEMSLGCNRKCDFCVAHRFHQKFHAKDVAQVIQEIKAMPGKMVTFLDPNVAGDAQYAREFFTEFKKLKKMWVGCVTIDIINRPELMDLMVESGAKGFLIGFESLDQEALDAANKGFSRVNDYQKAIKEFHRRGIVVQGSFVFGFDTDDLNTCQNTLDFVIKAKIDLPQFTIYTPFPGTEAFLRLEKEGRILTRDWSRYNGHEVVFMPKNMTPEQLKAGVDNVWKTTYSYSSILKRLSDPPYLIKPIIFLSNLNFRWFMKRVHAQ